VKNRPPLAPSAAALNEETTSLNDNMADQQETSKSGYSIKPKIN